MKNIARFFIENDKLTIVLSVALLIMGLIGLNKMKAESFPNVSFGLSIVTTVYQGASAEDIETKITKPLEDQIRTVSGLKDVRSISQAGLSSIFIRIDIENASIEKVVSDLQKAIDRTVGLPTDLLDAPKFIEVKSEEIPVFQIAVTGSNKGRQREIIADLLKEDLEDTPLVKSVRFSGFAKRQFDIIIDHKKLITSHISIDSIIKKIQSRNTNTPGGPLRLESKQNLIRVEGKIKSTEQIENILIRSNFSGKEIYLKDLAKVVDSGQELRVLARHNGDPATLMTVTKKMGADTIELVQKLKEKLKHFESTYKEKAKFHIFLNEATKVHNKISVLSQNGILGMVFVIFFLFIFLPGRIGIMASLSLPLTVMGTLAIMNAMGMNLNAITILALIIALGMLVDNSVVIAENFSRLRASGQSPEDSALNSIQELWLPITATALTTIAAFLPMLVTKGMMGQFIRYIPIIVSISLLLSLAESFFFLPMRLAKTAGKLKNKTKVETTKDWFHRFEKKFEFFMSRAIQHRYIALLIFSGIISFSIIMMVKVNNFVLFPAEQTEVYISRFQTPNGTTLKETDRLAIELSTKILAKLGKDIRNVVSKSGESRVLRNDPKAIDGNNVGIVYIYVTDHAINNLSSIYALKKLREIKVPGLSSLVFEALVNGPPLGEPIEATFRSNNSKDLDQLIQIIMADMKKLPGVFDLKVNDITGDDEIFVNIDYNKADKLGLNVRQVGNTIRSAISGKIISNVTLENKKIDLKIRLHKSQRTNIADLKKIVVRDNRGNLIPISTIATFEKRNGSPQIMRFEYKRSKTLTGNINDEVTTSIAANEMLVESYNKHKHNFPGASIVFGGAAESTKESMESLASAGFLAILGIFAILVFIFKSYLKPFIIMMTIPLGFFGLSIAFYLPILSGYADRSRPISFLALIGVIGLAGIIVNSGIVLISFIDQLKKEGTRSLHEILAKASGMRLRAVLVTSLTTISGLLPTAYGIGGADAMLVPMTLAMSWGLTSGTILTLVFVPCAYAIFEDYNIFQKRLVSRLFP